ncbi:MAG: hypothetical protein K8W52_33790 [Deltaproteobacteria bacterium]|nr:hypothetical protein [Deltaproteobacteria bacterium]
MLNPTFKEQVRILVCDLSRGAYAEVEADGRAGRLSAEILRRAVEEYGRQLVPIPEAGWALVDVYERTDVVGMVSMDVPLWTVEEGRSDLTLSLEASWVDGAPILRVENLHVM